MYFAKHNVEYSNTIFTRAIEEHQWRLMVCRSQRDPEIKKSNICLFQLYLSF